MPISTGRAVFASIVLLFAFSLNLYSQDLDEITISGRIVDSHQMAIAGAAVTAIQPATGLERKVMTNDSGRFRFIELDPGTYRIRAEASGFGTKERIDLHALSGQNLYFELVLAPADVTAEATVTVNDEDAPAVDITRTIVGGTITAREIEDLPVSTRDVLDLVLTLGGTSEESLSVSGLAEDRNVNSGTPPLEQGNFSLSGGTAYSNNLTIDGLDNNDDRSSRERFQPSLEAIEEVQVISNQFSAEYGRASGGRINLRTKAGNNRFRGRVFMFFRDDSLNANTWYNNSRGFARLPLTEYNPGFTLAGPVVLPIYNGRNRTFFSIAYEYNNILDTTFIDTYVPVGTNPRYSLPAGNAECPADIICVDGNSNPPVPLRPYNVLYDTPNSNHRLTARIDHRLASNNNLTVGWQFGRRNNRRTTGTSTTRLDDALQARKSDTDAYNLTNNHVFGSRVVNQFRIQYSTFSPRYETDNPFDPVVLIGYRNPQTGSTQTLIVGNSTASIAGDSTAFAQNRIERRWQIQDSVTIAARRQTLKGGFDIHTVRSKALGLGDATGTYNFANMLAFEQNILSRYRHNYGTRSDATNTYWGVFINDEIRAKTNLTLNLGLRYEREAAVSDSNNWGPRVGVAWNPFERKRSGVVRFGAGIFYNRVLLRTVADSIQNTRSGLISFDTSAIGTAATDPRRVAILAAIANSFPATFTNIEDLRSLVAATCAIVSTTFPCNADTGFVTNVSSAGNPLRSVEPDLKIPESYQANIGFEREIRKGIVFAANFTWNKTVRLWRDYNPNAPVLPPGYADWTAWLLANPFVLTNANGTTRTYNFVLGSATDTSGIGPGCSFTANSSCNINLNTTNTSSTTPRASVPGQNNNATGAPIGIALAAIAQFRPDPTVEETSRIGSRGKAFYQGLIVELRRRYRPLGFGFGASWRFAYTLSSTKDDGLNNTSNAEINGDFGREWARNLQDRRHRIAFTGTFETPRWLGRLRLSPLFRYGSSAPFNLGIGGTDRNLDDLGTDRVTYNGDLRDIVWRRPGSPIPTVLISQFSLQPIGSRSGNLPRNAGRGPSFYVFDLGVTREWKLGERRRLRPVIEINNVLNAAVFNFGSEFIDFTGLTASQSTAQQNFLVPRRTYRPRLIRLGVRFDF
jgi:hypothetical protein